MTNEHKENIRFGFSVAKGIGLIVLAIVLFKDAYDKFKRIDELKKELQKIEQMREDLRKPKALEKNVKYYTNAAGNLYFTNTQTHTITYFSGADQVTVPEDFPVYSFTSAWSAPLSLEDRVSKLERSMTNNTQP